MASSLTSNRLSVDSIYTNSDYYKIFSADKSFRTDEYTYASDTGNVPLHGGFIMYHVPTSLSYYTSSKTWEKKGPGGPGTIYTLAYKNDGYEYIFAPEEEAIFYYAMFKGEQPSQYSPNNFTKYGWYLYSPYMTGNVDISGDTAFASRVTKPSEEGIRVGAYKFFGDSFPYGMFCFVYILGRIEMPPDD